MRFATEKRLEGLEVADATEGDIFVVLDTLPEDGGGASEGRQMTCEEWEAAYCRGENLR